MEVRISCPDATGLGCDVARMLFDFGLRITDGALHPFPMVTPWAPILSHLLRNSEFAHEFYDPAGDVSTDGKWCFLIFKVSPCRMCSQCIVCQRRSF